MSLNQSLLSEKAGYNQTTKQLAYRRSKVEVYCDILRTIGSGVGGPTQIMFKSNVTWGILQNHLETLKSRNLISCNVSSGGRKNYSLTGQGYDLLKRYLQLKEDLDPVLYDL